MTVPAPESDPAIEPLTDDAQYYGIQDTGAADPWALVRIKDRGIYERWTGPDEGWVDMPGLAAYFVGGEHGAFAIDAEDATALRLVVPPMRPGNIALLRARSKSEAPATEEPEKPPAETPDGETPPVAEE